MKTMMLLFTSEHSLFSDAPGTEFNSYTWYAIAAIMAVLILCYLILALKKPDKL